MSFICDKCKQPTKQGTKPVVRVAEERQVIYNVRARAGEDSQGERIYEQQTRNGREIVREERLCPECANDAPTVGASQ